MKVFHVSKDKAKQMLKVLGQETTPILDTGVNNAETPNEPVIIIVD